MKAPNLVSDLEKLLVQQSLDDKARELANDKEAKPEHRLIARRYLQKSRAKPHRQ